MYESRATTLNNYESRAKAMFPETATGATFMLWCTLEGDVKGLALAETADQIEEHLERGRLTPALRGLAVTFVNVERAARIFGLASEADAVDVLAFLGLESSNRQLNEVILTAA
jgi:hypothetical protein